MKGFCWCFSRSFIWFKTIMVSAFPTQTGTSFWLRNNSFRRECWFERYIRFYVRVSDSSKLGFSRPKWPPSQNHCFAIKYHCGRSLKDIPLCDSRSFSWLTNLTKYRDVLSNWERLSYKMRYLIWEEIFTFIRRSHVPFKNVIWEMDRPIIRSTFIYRLPPNLGDLFSTAQSCELGAFPCVIMKCILHMLMEPAAWLIHQKIYH